MMETRLPRDACTHTHTARLAGTRAHMCTRMRAHTDSLDPKPSLTHTHARAQILNSMGRGCSGRLATN